MFSALYIEDKIKTHPLTKSLQKRFETLPHIACTNYKEIFNLKSQNFSLQKEAPAIILAEKQHQFLYTIPKDYGIGDQENYYFSHALNCLYDCRYCFLQGMFRSANLVIFVNFDDFKQSIKETVERNSKPTTFFSGYDCDSLALEPITHFAQDFLPFFDTLPNATLEIRTKSTNIQPFLNYKKVLDNVVIAYSLSPKEVVTALEHKTARLHQRIKCLQKLQTMGWKIGLRFDPIIYTENFTTTYRKFFDEVFAHLNVDSIHSITLGPFRAPKTLYKTMQKLHPKEPLFTLPENSHESLITYDKKLEQELLQFCKNIILKNIDEAKFFPCRSIT